MVVEGVLESKGAVLVRRHGPESEHIMKNCSHQPLLSRLLEDLNHPVVVRRGQMLFWGLLNCQQDINNLKTDKPSESPLAVLRMATPPVVFILLPLADEAATVAGMLTFFIWFRTCCKCLSYNQAACCKRNVGGTRNLVALWSSQHVRILLVVVGGDTQFYPCRS